MNSGFILINKPSGPTSHDIIDRLRRITGERRIGHAGTLDPFANGLLIVAVGREATRQISDFSKLDKTYIAKLRLGATSDTQDRTGKIQLQITNEELRITEEKIKKALEKFTGPQMQTPPMYSAKKIKGKKLYELARQGIEVEREPVKINVYYIKLLELTKEDKTENTTHLIIETRVSSGTYIRTLAHDIGQALGCGAYLEELARTEVGEHSLKDAADLEDLKNSWEKYLKKLK
ncbi:MAG: tRNA pseudouridine(55) synthase TruB [Patescibacteria group bacterium]